jgi:prepilin-type N-terminal cleavage/methylation domain-containing protein
MGLKEETTISATGRISGKKRVACQGFTLIELIFVTLIILVILGVSTPLFREAYDDMKLRDASGNVAKLMKYAREMAIMDRSKYRVCARSSSERYQLEIQRAGQNGGGGWETVESKLGRITLNVGDVNIKVSANEVVFYPDGSSDELVLQLSNRSGSVYTLTTAGTTGDVKIAKHRKE